MFGILRDFADGIRNMIFMMIERYDLFKGNWTPISYFSMKRTEVRVGMTNPVTLVHPSDPPEMLGCPRVAPLLPRGTRVLVTLETGMAKGGSSDRLDRLFCHEYRRLLHPIPCYSNPYSQSSSKQVVFVVLEGQSLGSSRSCWIRLIHITS